MRASASRAARARPRGWCYFCGVQWTCVGCRARAKLLQAEQDTWLREHIFPRLMDHLAERTAERRMFAGSEEHRAAVAAIGSAPKGFKPNAVVVNGEAYPASAMLKSRKLGSPVTQMNFHRAFSVKAAGIGTCAGMSLVAGFQLAALRASSRSSRMESAMRGPRPRIIVLKGTPHPTAEQLTRMQDLQASFAEIHRAPPPKRRRPFGWL